MYIYSLCASHILNRHICGAVVAIAYLWQAIGSQSATEGRLSVTEGDLSYMYFNGNFINQNSRIRKGKLINPLKKKLPFHHHHKL